jgi:drug/metabolite transporter (DMT)-like permease
VWRIRDYATARVLAIVAAVITAAVTAFYWYVITGQGDQDEQRPRFVAASLMLASLALLASTVTPTRSLRLLLLSLGSSTLLIWTVVGAMSIGVLLLPAAAMSLIAASKASSLLPSVPAWTVVTATAAVSLLLVLIGLGVF